MFTMSPDGRFLAGPVSDVPGLWFASGCNGSGFSSSPAIGELLAAGIAADAKRHPPGSRRWLRRTRWRLRDAADATSGDRGAAWVGMEDGCERLDPVDQAGAGTDDEPVGVDRPHRQ